MTDMETSGDLLEPDTKVREIEREIERELKQKVPANGTAGFGLKCFAATLHFLFLNYLRTKNSVVCKSEIFNSFKKRSNLTIQDQ